MGKGEIARYEQFLLFPQCFQKACFTGVSKGVIVWEWVNLESEKDHEVQNDSLRDIIDQGHIDMHKAWPIIKKYTKRHVKSNFSLSN